MKKPAFALVFDWDDVVFRTAAFKENLAVQLAKKGISKKVVLETVSIAKDGHGYNPAIHARMIVARSGGRAPAITKLIWSNCRLLEKRLLYPDAARAIRSAHRAKTPLYVLSAGRKQFQSIKIEGSGLAGFFLKIDIVDITDLDAAAATKAKILESIARRHGKAVFLDDRHKTIAGIQAARRLKGKVLPLLVWRQKGRPPHGLQAMRRLNWQEIRKLGERFAAGER